MPKPPTHAGVQPGVVYLCGAGPGSPDLLTLRAARLLASAQVVLPDDLVSHEVLALADPQAEIIPVGKRSGRPRITQAGIHTLMIEHAQSGRSVLRLKSGDPFVFGRIGEEIEALSAAGVPFEIVPGVTAAFAVAASLQTPLTDRSASSRLLFATAHHSAGRERAPAHYEPSSTLVLYMPGRDFARLSQELLISGYPAATPVAAVSRAATPHEMVVLTTVADLADSSPGPAPLLLLVGESISPRWPNSGEVTPGRNPVAPGQEP